MNAANTNRRGFTIIEIIIAIIVLTVGILGMVTTAALVTRMIARGQRSASAAAFAQRRMELLRAGVCTAVPVDASDTLYRGSSWIAINTWTTTNLGNQNFRLKVQSLYKTQQNKVRRDSVETTLSCNTFL
jgi:Tfp pilus assembly protein PilV